jgi:hypothetical protein
MDNITQAEAEKKLDLHNNPEEDYNLTPKTKAKIENIAQGNNEIPQRYVPSQEDLNSISTGNMFANMEGGKKRKSRKMRRSRKSRKMRKLRKSRKSKKAKKSRKSRR